MQPHQQLLQPVYYIQQLWLEFGWACTTWKWLTYTLKGSCSAAIGPISMQCHGVDAVA
jgi:hypothetical protein